MKHSQPIIAVLESSADVQSMRDATGDVMEIGQCTAKGDVADSPLGIRRYNSEIELWSDLASKSLGQKMKLVPDTEIEVLPETKTVQAKRKAPVKRKKATRKK